MPDSNRDAVLCLVTVFILSFLITKPLLADELTNDFAAHKIIVFGASGRVGSRVVNEALDRGHDVTAVTRNPSASGQQDGQAEVVEGDILDVTRVAELVTGQDVVVVSIRGSADGSKDADKAIQRVAAELLVEVLRGMDADAPRLIYVGGAGSLEIEPGVLYADSVSGVMRIFMPRSLRQEIAGHVLTLEYLRTVGDVDWVYISPAKDFEPGPRTGAYRVGGDVMLKNESGQSMISMEDYALALIDEIENPLHHQTRFSVAY
jgi:putative NADH-flavin reductase